MAKIVFLREVSEMKCFIFPQNNINPNNNYFQVY